MESSENQPLVASPGSLLRQAREARDISPREMADRLNWMPDYVGAIEENRFDALRGAAFVRGYLRAYAKQVDISEADILGAYQEFVGDHESVEGTDKKVETVLPQVQKRGWALPAGIVFVVLLLAVLWFVQAGEEASLPAPEQVAATSMPTAQEVVVDSSVVESSVDFEPEPDLIPETEPAFVSGEAVAIETSAGDEVSAVEADSTELSEAMMEVVDQAADAAFTDLTSGAEPAAAEDVAELGGALLEFSFSGECWLEVRDAADKLIYADLRQAGDELTLRGDAPFNVLVGDSRYAKVFLNGEQVEVVPRPGRVIARVVVGES